MSSPLRQQLARLAQIAPQAPGDWWTAESTGS
jgi:hypothetical protein